MRRNIPRDTGLSGSEEYFPECDTVKNPDPARGAFVVRNDQLERFPPVSAPFKMSAAITVKRGYRRIQFCEREDRKYRRNRRNVTSHAIYLAPLPNTTVRMVLKTTQLSKAGEQFLM